MSRGREADKAGESAAPDEKAPASSGKQMCVVKHGGIYIGGVLLEQGATFEALDADVHWMLGTGNIELVKR